MLAPHDLVLLTYENPIVGTYYLWAEIISKETPEETIMVRTVPDDPTTMIEVPLDRIRKPNRIKPKFVKYARVVPGLGSFPVDMLRYDQCVPVNFALDENDRVVPQEDDLIIAKCVASNLDQYHPDRWRSFLWAIEPMKVLKLSSHLRLAK